MVSIQLPAIFLHSSNGGVVTQLAPAHQALIDRILKVQDGGMNCRQIAAFLNDQGITSWTGKRFYP